MDPPARDPKMALKRNHRAVLTKEKINKVLHGFLMPISSLTLDPKNARVHSERNIEVIKESLDQFGQQIPIVHDNKKIVLKGNATVLAARALKWKVIAATKFDSTNPKQLTGFKITDNKSAELAAWSYEILAGDIKSVIDSLDWMKLGWEQYELDPLLQADWMRPAVDDSELSAERGITIVVTKEQKAIIDQAVESCRARKKDLSEGQALELICLDYLAKQ